MPRLPGRRAAPAARPVRPFALRPAVRPGGGVRRTRPVRRASAGLTPVRAGALLVALASSAAIYGLASSSAFAVARTTVTGTAWTTRSEILEAMAVPAGDNVFTIRTSELEHRLAAIPALRGATVTVALPDEIRAVIDEREAILVWKAGDRRFLVDRDGLLFAELGADAPARADALPIVDDGRAQAGALSVGSTLDAVTLDAALRLGSLTPAEVGTAATAIVLRVDDTNGFTMRTQPPSWTAVFGFYTPTLRTTDLVPGQVRLLRSLLAGREDEVARIILADDHSGTYVPKATPEPTKQPKG